MDEPRATVHGRLELRAPLLRTRRLSPPRSIPRVHPARWSSRAWPTHASAGRRSRRRQSQVSAQRPWRTRTSAISGFWHRVDDAFDRGGLSMHPHSLQFWVAFGVAGLGIWTVIGLGVLAARAVVRRVLPARVAVDAGGLTVGDGRAARRIAREDIERVDPGEASAVMVALRTGRAIRLRFSPDRPVVERDDFIARVHTIMAEPAIATYPAAETSGVRVAFRAEGTAIEEEADAAKPLARARRR